MESRVIYIEEVDDMEEAAREIFEKCSDFELKANSLAVIFTEEETDYPELYELLSEKWNFPIIGCTTMAMLASGAGYRSDGMSIMVMTADDCKFAAGVTDELTKENYKDKVRELYQSLSGELGEEEKVIISYGVCVTAMDHVAGDDLLHATDAAGKAMPIFGGLASDRFSFEETRVFCGDKVVENGQVMALVAGNMQIKYMHVNSVDTMANPKAYTVTKSHENEVLCLDGKPMVDVLAEENFVVNKQEVMRDYLLTPFVVTIEKEGDAKVRVGRNLSFLDLEKKSGFFLGEMPEGSRLEIGIVNQEKVRESLKEVLEDMLLEIKGSGYHYSTILCTSCAARYLALTTQIEEESEKWFPMLPDGITLMGMYSYGEFCPASDTDEGKDYNMFHNFTFTMLAM
ncbi:MAG: FIST C-terminal domain-containing protein [Eubacterium sp.]|nr:FIST C-terminal domain-containing protein [Eubacterium sp.]